MHVVYVTCRFCGHVGEIRDPEAVARLLTLWRPRRFLCAACRRSVPGAAALVSLGWKSAGTPFD